MLLKGAVFDLDGTVVEVPYDWEKIRKKLGTRGAPILSYLENLEEPERSAKRSLLHKYEEEATRRAVLKKGIRGLLSFLKSKGVKTALVTNNTRKNVSGLLEKFNLRFDFVMTRESGLWKPSGAPLRAALDNMGLRRKECCAIGDSPFDVLAAEEAGIKLIFILSRNRERFPSEGVEIFPDVRSLRKRLEDLLAD